MTALALPSSRYGAFQDKGYAFEAHLPASSQEQRAFLVLVRRPLDECVLLRVLVPMCYAPVFGVDIGDSAQLDAVIDAVLAVLSAGGQAGPLDIDHAAQAAQAQDASRLTLN